MEVGEVIEPKEKNRHIPYVDKEECPRSVEKRKSFDAVSRETR